MSRKIKNNKFNHKGREAVKRINKKIYQRVKELEQDKTEMDTIDKEIDDLLNQGYSWEQIQKKIIENGQNRIYKN